MSLRTILSNSIALVALDVLGKLLPLVTFPWVTRTLGPETYGKLSFALTVIGLFSLLGSPGFTVYGIREVARSDPADTGGIRSLIAALTGARLVFSVVAYGLLAVFAFAHEEASTRFLILVGGCGFVISAFSCQWVYEGLARMWLVAGVSVIGQIAYTLVVVLGVSTRQDAWLVVFSSLVIPATLATGIYFLAVVKRFGFVWPRISFGAWNGFLSSCLFMGASSGMSMVYDKIDTLLLGYFRGNAELGMYSAAYKIMGIGLSFLPIVGRVFFPFVSSIAGKDRVKEHKVQDWAFIVMIGSSLPISVGGVMTADRLVALLAGGQYADAVPLLQWLMPNVIAGSLASYFTGRLLPYGCERAYFTCVGIGAASNLLLNLIFIPWYGGLAAAITTVASQGLVAISGAWLGRHIPAAGFMRPLLVSLIGTLIMVWFLSCYSYMISDNIVIVILYGGLVYITSFLLVWRCVSYGRALLRHTF